MPRPYSRRKKYVPREQQSHWLTFSDLMSALVLVFILVMFYSVYQYFDMLELKTAELTRQSGVLEAREAELSASRGKLTMSEEALAQEQYKLMVTTQAQEAAEKSLAEQRAQLDAALAQLQVNEQELDTARTLVTDQQTALATQQATLTDQQQTLQTQQAQLASQQATLTDQETSLESQRALLLHQQTILSDQQTQLEAMVGVRARIVESLAEALTKANVKAKVDGATGSIALDANVLFDVGKSELKPGGIAALNEFLPVYLGVLESEEYQKNISEVIIEGHTDSTGNYLDNLKLSQARALAVMSYVIGPQNTFLSANAKSWLRRVGTCNGRSYSNTIPDASGAEDANASRRVEFKFRMQDEQMIQSMRDILGSADEKDAAETVMAAPDP